MSNNINLQPRPHHPLVTKIEALYLGQINPDPIVIVKYRSQLHSLINQWLAVACLCFIVSIILDFIFIA